MLNKETNATLQLQREAVKETIFSKLSLTNSHQRGKEINDLSKIEDFTDFV